MLRLGFSIVDLSPKGVSIPMQTSQISKRFVVPFGRAAAAGLFAVAITTTATLSAQQTFSNRTVATPETIDFLAEAKAPVALAAPTTDAGYSSSAEPTSAVAAERLTLSSAASSSDVQPPPRRRYGRPRYQDRGHNPDGSNRYTFEFGGGMTVPTGATGKRTTLSYSLKGGAGINFNKKLGVMAEYNYDHFGITGSTLANQTTLFNNLYGNYVDPNTGQALNFNGLDGNAHVWSLTVNPMYTFHEGEKSSAYVVVGGGFYRKITAFTLPTIQVGYSYYYGPYQYVANQTVENYSNNAGGVNGGIGFTYKPSRFAGERFFAEARYVEVFNSASANSVNSDYPPSNARTGYFPVTVGIRF